MTKIEPQRVSGRDSLHDHRQRHRAHLDSEMEMISHQAIGDDVRSCRVLNSMHGIEKVSPVAIVGEYLPPVHAARHRMINGAGEVDSWISSHSYYTIDHAGKLHAAILQIAVGLTLW